MIAAIRVFALALAVGVGTPAASAAPEVASAWTFEGRVAHHTAMHHLVKLRDVALTYMADRLRRGQRLTVEGVQHVLDQGYRMRGLSGPLPFVATGVDTATPKGPRNSDFGGTQIKLGDVVQLHLRGALAESSEPIPAELWWVMYVGDSVPGSIAKDFSSLVAARDAGLTAIRERIPRSGEVNRYDVERQIRTILNNQGLGSPVRHDALSPLEPAVKKAPSTPDAKTNDDSKLAAQTSTNNKIGARSTGVHVLRRGRGFAIAPAVYRADKYGLRSSVSVYLTERALNVTSPLQRAVTPIMIKSR